MLQVDIEKISQGLQFVCNDLLWLQEPERAAKILMRCQTTHLYSMGLQIQFLFNALIDRSQIFGSTKVLFLYAQNVCKNTLSYIQKSPPLLLFLVSKISQYHMMHLRTCTYVCLIVLSSDFRFVIFNNFISDVNLLD